jgi:hypothetical protein
MGIEFWKNPRNTVSEIIHAWSPSKKYKTKSDCEYDLFCEIKYNLEDVAVKRQYGSGAHRVDIGVGNKVAIELKKDLRNSATVNKIMGEVKRLLKSDKWEFIIIVICGYIIKEHLEELEHLADNNSDYVEVIPKGKIYR